MDNKKYEVYQNIMLNSPILDEGYLNQILCLSKNEKVNRVEITEIVESNTSLVIRASVQVQDFDDLCVKELFIKTMKRNKSKNVYHNLSMQEGKFYQLLKENFIHNLPMPNCYDVFFSDEKGAFVIILEDIAKRYTPPDNTILTDKNIWFSCAESLARFHSTFWNHETLPLKKYEAEHDDQGDRDCLLSFLNNFKEQFDDKLKTILKQAMEINIALIKELSQRINNKENITICNGDSHIGNFMLPKRNTDRPLMIDFQFWGDGLGTGDLAHLTRDRFPDEFKRKIQLPLVEHYYQSLLSSGVTDYQWDKCLLDYRTSVASMVLIPLWQYAGFGLKYEDWIGDLRVYADNYEYMKCDELYHAL